MIPVVYLLIIQGGTNNLTTPTGRYGDLEVTKFQVGLVD